MLVCVLGHIQIIIDEGGATSGECSILQNDNEVQVASVYIFPNKAAYENYQNGLAVKLRPEGIRLFYETKKVIRFERTIAEIGFVYNSSIEYSIASIVPFIKFTGNCLEVMQFYHTALGGEIDIKVLFEFFE